MVFACAPMRVLVDLSIETSGLQIRRGVINEIEQLIETAQHLTFGFKEIDNIFATTTLPWPWFHNAYFGDFKRRSHACSMESHDIVILAVCVGREPNGVVLMWSSSNLQ